MGDDGMLVGEQLLPCEDLKRAGVGTFTEQG